MQQLAGKIKEKRMSILSIFGDLISKFGLTKVVASTIVGLLSSGASYSVVIIYPYFVPFIATAQAYLAMFGVAAGISF
ncbi:hypothetical protein IKG38_04455 [Candidatus Saccharibacteria bacterium]|nr:hypothetical protein [Candidatus Saccharibacteria bacterium]MBR3139224.1 hypothetical protein [Candidatus Saccharibacteria bacterium]